MSIASTLVSLKTGTAVPINTTRPARFGLNAKYDARWGEERSLGEGFVTDRWAIEPIWPPSLGI